MEHISTLQLSKSDIVQSFLGQFNKKWYQLADVARLKGVSYKTVCNKTYLQPKGGIPDAKIGGRKAWKLETVLDWIELGDHELEAQ